MKPLKLGLLLLAAGAVPVGPRPVFVPGLYETETRDSASPDHGVRRRLCLAADDYPTFRRETIARYLILPQFRHVCRLSQTREIADGFAFAMDCGGAETLLAFHLAEGLIRATTRTRIVLRPENSSSSLTLSRRIGPCPRTPPPDEAL